MKNRNLIAGLVAVVVIVLFVIAGMMLENRSLDYEKAYNKTNDLSSFKAEISTIVTIADHGDTKTSTIDQKISVFHKNKTSMRYEVETDALSTDENNGGSITQTNSYLYSKGYYYYTYPGIRYKSKTEHELAVSNITDLCNVISFPFDKMYNVVKSSKNGEAVYEYEVDYEDVSPHVRATVENAVSLFEDGSFKNTGMYASATVKGGYVIKRDMYIEYSTDDGRSVTVEVYTKLTDKKASIPMPDENSYAEIEG